ncbi:MAG TPA: GNAT family N-acetyltransferase [Pyrinomonadaceae bacterium]|nr:GNAT family N-acetyltransferase [Chloracidobacterium sp.]MBP9936222.1 GNAT family N-acetyltransferase [Pyrinomonadaceae bacterium]MBK7803790.1 GNAT family N-acetyltransferase [Chloracidobacterium sp.]MBK9439538.1 GNAT family N-acetyltransferase [Chloracidobacterium sp.]MBL0239173.1 GNAT family N-acetyltransferase [Chloracidobacterium sp.]
MNETMISIRPFCEEDLGEWFRLRQLLWDETDQEDHQREMMDILDHRDTQFVVVADNGHGQLAGFLEASIRPFVEDCESENVGYLEGWYVDKAYRRLGVGSRLVELAEKWARQRGCTEMASDAEIDNGPSLAAHDRLGYKETSRLVHLRKNLD